MVSTRANCAFTASTSRWISSWISRGAAQAGEIGEGHSVVLGELLDVLVIDHDEAGEIWPLVADHHRIGDVGREFELVLDLGRRDVLAARR